MKENYKFMEFSPLCGALTSLTLYFMTPILFSFIWRKNKPH